MSKLNIIDHHWDTWVVEAIKESYELWDTPSWTWRTKTLKSRMCQAHAEKPMLEGPTFRTSTNLPAIGPPAHSYTDVALAGKVSRRKQSGFSLSPFNLQLLGPMRISVFSKRSWQQSERSSRITLGMIQAEPKSTWNTKLTQILTSISNKITKKNSRYQIIVCLSFGPFKTTY